MGSAGRARALACFGAERFAREVDEVLHAAARRGAGRGRRR
jgi:hypothetical protein